MKIYQFDQTGLQTKYYSSIAGIAGEIRTQGYSALSAVDNGRQPFGAESIEEYITAEFEAGHRALFYGRLDFPLDGILTEFSVKQITVLD